MTDSFRIGIIGGSGVYQMEALQEMREITLDTPFGAPSDAYITGVLDGTPVAFLARHGRGHRISPTRLNQRAICARFPSSMTPRPAPVAWSCMSRWRTPSAPS